MTPAYLQRGRVAPTRLFLLTFNNLFSVGGAFAQRRSPLPKALLRLLEAHTQREQ